MAHFAEIDENSIVKRVIVAEQDFINSGAVGDPKNWIQTSYNTKGGKHRLGGTPLRMNFAGMGYKYDKDMDAFIPPQPFSSWKLEKKTCHWKAPKVMPGERGYDWDEKLKDWKKVK